MPNWLERSLIALILIPLIATILFSLEPEWYCLLIASVSLIGLHELFALLKNQGYKPFVFPGLVFAFALLLAAYLRPSAISGPFQAIMGSFAVFLLLAQFRRGLTKGYFGDIAVSFLGVFYVAGLMSFAILLRFVPGGLRWVVLMLAAIWLFDTLAYAFGRIAGRHKLWPVVSPKKTWEGFWGGALSTSLILWVLAKLPERISGFPLPLPNLPPTVLAGLVFLNCVAAQAGDLAESMIKRAAGKKDSSQILPGHGGMLDKLDSFTFSAPFLYAISLII